MHLCMRWHNATLFSKQISATTRFLSVQHLPHSHHILLSNTSILLQIKRDTLNISEPKLDVQIMAILRCIKPELSQAQDTSFIQPYLDQRRADPIPPIPRQRCQDREDYTS